MVSLLFDYVMCCYVFEKPLKTKRIGISPAYNAKKVYTKPGLPFSTDPPTPPPPRPVPLIFLVKRKKN